MKKTVSLLLSALIVISSVHVTFAQSSTTNFTSFDLSSTEAAYVAKNETISITIKDNDGNALSSENAALSFESSNPAVATVDADGEVTGVNPGLAVITAKLSNNSPALPDQKIVISVTSGNSDCQSFEGVNDSAWPTTKPRTGSRSYAAYSDSGSTFSYRDSNGAEQSANRNSWGGATRQVEEVWFYDDGSSFTNNGPTVFIQRSNGKNIFSFRIGTEAYYAKNETAGFEPTITETRINNTVTRSEGWHQVVFDFTKGNMGNNSGERKVYLDGAVIYSQSYTFDEGGYVAPSQICVQANNANLTGTLFFDDMNAYSVTRDYSAKAIVTDLTVTRKRNHINSSYKFYDSNDLADNSVYQWQSADSENGEYTDIMGAVEGNYTLTDRDAGKYIRLKVIPNNGTEEDAVYSNALNITDVDPLTDYSSFNLSYTENTHVAKGETVSLTVKDGAGNVLTGANADLSFESLNPAVATVDADGNVTGVNPGLAVITAKLSNNIPELSDQKIVISVTSGNSDRQSFEGVNDSAWPTTKPRTGERSYAAYSDSGSSFSYRDSNGTEQSANRNSWGGATRQVEEVWFYDDGSSFTNNGPNVFIQRSNGKNIFSFRIGTEAYYAKNETAGFEPTITETRINNTVTRSEGWHQVVFDFTKGNMGNNSGERKVYLDGAVIYSQSYTFDEGGYVAPSQICVQANNVNLTGTLFFDDMNAYCVTRDYTVKPIVSDITVSRKGECLYGEYSFYDANDAADCSEYQWQSADSENGDYSDISGATDLSYALTSEDIGRYIRLKVTPYNGSVYGDAAYSDAFGPIEADLPLVSEPNISVVSEQSNGNAAVGDSIAAEYTYQGLLDENNSEYRWLCADSENSLDWITIGEGRTESSTAVLNTGLTITPAMNGKYIKFEITPVDSSGTRGASIESAAKLIDTQKIYPSKDCGIMSNDADANSNTHFCMISNAEDKVRMQIIRYDFGESLTPLQNITKVTAKFYVIQALYMSNTNTMSLYPVTTSDWDESSATWNSLKNYVDTSAAIGSTTITKNQTGWYEIDITDYVKSQILAGKTGIDVAMWSSDLGNSQYIQVACRERSATSPLLVVDAADDMSSNMPVNITSVSYPVSEGENGVKTEIGIKNNTLETVEGTLVSVLYSGSKTISVLTEDISIAPNGKEYKNAAFDLCENEQYSIKAFIWDSMSGLVPLANAYEASFNKSELATESEKENFHIYLCIGQSNMAGRAPIEDEDIGGYDGVYLFNQNNEWEAAACGEYNGNLQGFNRYSTTERDYAVNGISPAHSFSKIIAAANPNITVGIVSNARGGTSLNEWVKGAETGYYEATLARLKEAMKYGTLKGILWHQGEADQSTYLTYIPRLRNFINDLRTDLDMDTLPFVAGQLLPQSAVFNNMIINLPNSVLYTDCVSGEGTTDIGDNAHFDNASAKLLGERYAEKILEFVYR